MMKICEFLQKQNRIIGKLVDFTMVIMCGLGVLCGWTMKMGDYITDDSQISPGLEKRASLILWLSPWSKGPQSITLLSHNRFEDF